MRSGFFGLRPVKCGSSASTSWAASSGLVIGPPPAKLADAGDAGAAEAGIDGCPEAGAAGADAPAELEHATRTASRTARGGRVRISMSQRRSSHALSFRPLGAITELGHLALIGHAICGVSRMTFDLFRNGHLGP